MKTEIVFSEDERATRATYSEAYVPFDPYLGAITPAAVSRPIICTDLDQRIRAMAARWDYAADELAEALALAAAGPEAWQRLVEHDEPMTA